MVFQFFTEEVLMNDEWMTADDRWIDIGGEA
jgi:hypothetical protein